MFPDVVSLLDQSNIVLGQHGGGGHNLVELPILEASDNI